MGDYFAVFLLGLLLGGLGRSCLQRWLAGEMERRATPIPRHMLCRLPQKIRRELKVPQPGLTQDTPTRRLEEWARLPRKDTGAYARLHRATAIQELAHRHRTGELE